MSRIIITKTNTCNKQNQIASNSLPQNLLKPLIFFLLTISYIFIPRVSDSNVVEEELPSDNILASLGSFETSRAEAVAVWIGSRELKKIGSLLILRTRRGIPLSESNRQREIAIERERFVEGEITLEDERFQGFEF